METVIFLAGVVVVALVLRSVFSRSTSSSKSIGGGGTGGGDGADDGDTVSGKGNGQTQF